MEETRHLVPFSPPYSPDGSPIEYLFNVGKAKLEAIGATTMAPLPEAVAKILESVNEQNVDGYSMSAESRHVACRHYFFITTSPNSRASTNPSNRPNG